MKKIFLAAAIIGMSGFAFGQQQQTASASKDSKCSKSCMKSCGDKSCKKGSCCTKDGKKATSSNSASSTKAASDKK
jgi:uncharacterized protein HemX